MTDERDKGLRQMLMWTFVALVFSLVMAAIGVIVVVWLFGAR